MVESLRISASPVGVCSRVQYLVIRGVLANHQVGVPVVSLLLIYVVNFSSWRKRMPKSPLGYENVLINVSARMRPWMLRSEDMDVAFGTQVTAALPGGMCGLVILVVTFDKPYRSAFHISPFFIRELGNRCRFSASTFTHLHVPPPLHRAAGPALVGFPPPAPRHSVHNDIDRFNGSRTTISIYSFTAFEAVTNL